MEYLPGGTLRSRAGGRQLASAELVAYALQIADGLGYAHRRGIIHRDLKPENMLFTEDGRLKISDFGLARLRRPGDVTRTEAITGTLAYLAPECVEGMEPDHRADIFSLGVMLYEMAAGEPPFRGIHAAAVLYDIVHQAAPCLRRLRPDLPEALRHVVARAMEKDRERRYQSMEELAGELRGEPTAELQPAPREPEPEAAQTILVAEDEDDLRNAVRMSLAAEGYRVLTVRNGREAVRGALEQQPDLVLLDVMMPGLNGLDACRELRQRGFPGPIVMLTGKAEEIDRVLGLEMGADDYVTKPFSARELLSRVRAHLRRERRAAASLGSTSIARGSLE
jgi:CheY-like chemotaxis protein